MPLRPSAGRFGGVDAAALDPLAIGKIMVDQVWAEGINPTGGGLYYERNSNQHRRLQAFETGSEDFMTGGWVRVLAAAIRGRDAACITCRALNQGGPNQQPDHLA